MLEILRALKNVRHVHSGQWINQATEELYRCSQSDKFKSIKIPRSIALGTEVARKVRVRLLSRLKYISEQIKPKYIPWWLVQNNAHTSSIYQWPSCRYKLALTYNNQYDKLEKRGKSFTLAIALELPIHIVRWESSALNTNILKYTRWASLKLAHCTSMREIRAASSRGSDQLPA